MRAILIGRTTTTRPDADQYARIMWGACGDAGTDDSAQALHRRSRWTSEIADAMKDKGETGPELLEVPH